MASAANAVDADPLPSSTSPRAPRQPWSHVVRGDPEAPTSATSSPPPVGFSDHPDRSPQKTPPPPDDVAAASSSSSDAARAKRPAWNRPPNGSVEVGAAVMGGAASWPALSESTKFAPKSPSLDALNDLSDGPLSVPPGLVVSNSSPKPNMNPTTNSDHEAPVRQKSMRRGGGTSGSSGNGAPSDNGMVHSSPSPTPQTNSEKQTLPELSPRDQPSTNTANWDHGSRGGGSGSQANDGVNHNRGYGGTRRWNTFGGSGSHQNNYGNRYDGYRRNAGGRDFQMQQRNPRSYYRLPVSPVAPSFISPPTQVRPFGNPPMVFSDVPSPVLYVATQPPSVGVPFVPHPAVPPALFIPALDPQRASLLHQIDYYFSPENLCRDVYLRQNMDEQGWVPISLIAGFNRVRQLTNNIDFILDTVRLSNVVEVQGDKIRKRNDWINWVLPPSNNQFANTSTQPPATPNSDHLAARFQSVGLNGIADRSSTVVPSLRERTR